MSDAADALPVPGDLRPLLAKHAGLDWEAVAWSAVRARVAQLERAEALAARSRLTAAQARALGAKLRGGGSDAAGP